MKIYCDENIESAIVKGLRRRDIEVISAQDTEDLGKSDQYHLECASKLGAVILTHDADLLKIALLSSPLHYLDHSFKVFPGVNS